LDVLAGWIRKGVECNFRHSDGRMHRGVVAGLVASGSVEDVSWCEETGGWGGGGVGPAR
jgi:hypothetical protein